MTPRIPPLTPFNSTLPGPLSAISLAAAIAASLPEHAIVADEAIRTGPHHG